MKINEKFGRLSLIFFFWKFQRAIASLSTDVLFSQKIAERAMIAT